MASRQKESYGPDYSSQLKKHLCHPLEIKRNKQYTITTSRDGNGMGLFSFIIYHGSPKAPELFYFVKELGINMEQILIFKATKKDMLYLSYWNNDGKGWKQVPAKDITIKSKR
jgi:hypothetical protein